MRLFTAIALSDEIRQNLGDLIGRLKPAARINWNPAANLHITTKFIGDWPPERLDELNDALGALPSRPVIPIEIRGLGWFPNPRSPRVFWAGVDVSDGLPDLAMALDRQLQPLGIEPERRQFSPHLTLARIKDPKRLDGLREAVDRLTSSDFGSFTADRFHLFSSDLSSSGAVYTSIGAYPFGKP